MPSRLGYWKIRGLAQPIRMLLKYAGEEFTEDEYEQGDAPDFSRAAWTDKKDKLGLHFSNLPYFIDDGVKITQSNAILLYIAKKHNLMGKDNKEFGYAVMILEEAMDFRNGVVRMVYNPEYETMLEDYKKNKLSDLLKRFDSWLSDKKWFAGDNVTVADFPMYELLDQHRLMIGSTCLDGYPKLKQFMTNFEGLAPIKQYMASEQCMKRPVNNKVAKFK